MKATQFIKLIILIFYTIACTNKNPAETSGDNTKDTTVVSSAETIHLMLEKLLIMLFAKLMLLNLMLYIFL